MGENEKWMDAGTFNILYEEGPVLAVNKESGILTQAPAGIDSLEARVRAFLIRREEKPGGCYLGIPHRLDRPASGVILFAKHVRAANRLSEQFRTRTVEKKYWALVSGCVPDDEGEWIDYMRKTPGRAEAELIAPIHPDAREAILKFRVLGRLTHPEPGDVTHLEIELETGRTHQIRLQASSRGYPILGDSQYGSTVSFGEQFNDERLNAIALHSRKISFDHPMTRERVALTAPLPQAWTPFRTIDASRA
ncbi:MAG: RluA family pseudouridine synthase [Thermoguttaceae bacterium]|jgi:23S rRNA pseudouridine1911/1915/1917 synthase